MTYTLNGIIDSSTFLNTSGTLAGLVSVGDTFTLTTTVDQDGPADTDASSSSNHQRRWFSGNTASMSINGETYTINDSPSDYSRAHAFTNSDFIEYSGFSNSINTGASTETGTSTLAAIDSIRMQWFLWDRDGQNDILDFSDPRFPAVTSLSDWTDQYLSFNLTDVDSGGSSIGSLYFERAIFTSVTTDASSGTGVPAPGAMALLGLGLIGLGIHRRAA